MTKEYIVSLKKGVDYDTFWNEMESPTSGLTFVPDRRVTIVNNRDVSIRQCHYALTDEEAEILRADSRVVDVERPTRFKPFHSATQTGDFTKTSLESGSYVNWGLKRCISETNNYGTGTTVTGNYTYTLDGSTVDVVIQDSGLQVDHPEFQDENGFSRVQQIDWYQFSGVSGTMSPNHYQDYDGHGTHVAGIVAGKTYGWAKGANIYSVKVAGLEGGGDSGGLPDPDCFDVIIGWHNNKPIDPVLGYKRPTIVNMSWGYGDYFSNINGGNYRGTSWGGTSRQTAYGMIGAYTGGLYRHGVRVNYIDVSIQEMIDAGIHVCIAAGNDYQKIDVAAGADYNNYYVGGYFNGSSPNYYNRGSSPFDDEAFIVGSVDSTAYDAVRDQKSVFSAAGPGVNIFAPGSDIMSATSNTNAFTDAAYFLDSNFRQMNISGTSMASPQVCGLGALILQMEPKLTPAKLRERIFLYSKTTLHSTGLDTDYTNSRSIKGSENRMLYNPFSAASNTLLDGTLTVDNLIIKQQ